MSRWRISTTEIIQSAIGNRQSAIKLVRHQRSVSIRPAIAKELPRIAHLANFVEIQICNHQRVLVARTLSHKLAARITKITLTVKLANVPGLFVSDAIDCANEVSVCHRVSWLFDSPEILRKTCHSGRWIENYLGAVQTQGPGPFRKVTVVTNINSDAGKRRIEGGISE